MTEFDIQSDETQTTTGSTDTAARKPPQSSATARSPWLGDSIGGLAIALAAGLAFGFLLQKGGVAKFDILVGVLLLEEFTVVKVMVSAIIVGVIGMAILGRMGLVTPQVRDTTIGMNTVGGVIFGVGFGLLAYCPGTDAAAVGQGNLDAIVGIIGLIAGSYLFALCSGHIDATIGRWGRCGPIRLPDVVPLPGWALTIIVAAVLVGVLVAIELLMSQ